MNRCSLLGPLILVLGVCLQHQACLWVCRALAAAAVASDVCVLLCVRARA